MGHDSRSIYVTGPRTADRAGKFKNFGNGQFGRVQPALVQIVQLSSCGSDCGFLFWARLWEREGLKALCGIIRGIIPFTVPAASRETP